MFQLKMLNVLGQGYPKSLNELACDQITIYHNSCNIARLVTNDNRKSKNGCVVKIRSPSRTVLSLIHYTAGKALSKEAPNHIYLMTFTVKQCE